MLDRSRQPRLISALLDSAQCINEYILYTVAALFCDFIFIVYHVYYCIVFYVVLLHSCEINYLLIITLLGIIGLRGNWGHRG